MKILIIKMRFPYPVFSGTDHVSLNLIKALSEEHEVSLMCHVRSEANIKDVSVLKKYCKEVIVVKYPDMSSKYKRLWKRIKREFLFFICFIPRDVIDNVSDEIEEKITEHLEVNKYDVVQIEYFYAAKYRKYIKDSVSVILSNDAYYETVRQFFIYEKRLFRKAIRYFEYISTKWYELRAYKRFDWVFFISRADMKIVAGDINLKNKKVIPVIMENNDSNSAAKPEPCSMVFVGGLQALFNIDAVKYFCNEIYPLIREEIPQATFSIVGSSPRDDVVKLAKIPGVIVTGSVQDVKPFIEKAALYVAPLRMGTGIKTKILEAMSMGKAIVTTSMGVQGLDVINERDLYIEDDKVLFAKRVVTLLKSPEKCEEIGTNSKKYFNRNHQYDAAKKEILRAYKDICLTQE